MSGNIEQLKTALKKSDSSFWPTFHRASEEAKGFFEHFALTSLRKKAIARGLLPPNTSQTSIRLAIVGGCSLYPLSELLTYLAAVRNISLTLWLGSFDNYTSEILDETSELYAFRPGSILIIPSERRHHFTGNLAAGRDAQLKAAQTALVTLLELAKTAHLRSSAEIIVANFLLPATHDLGAYRSRNLGSDWTFKKWLNLELGLQAPTYVHICDLEFLGNRFGALAARDERLWHESKQLCSPDMLVELGREIVAILQRFHQPSKKVLVLDLDNTLWGGVIAEDGLEGIQLGDTSAIGEAYKSFQKYILRLKDRGVVLAISSKNDREKAMEPFLQHPEMVLRMNDIVSFQANWGPKSESIRQIANELNLGLSSFVFVDDNPAEIEVVRQFVPEVSTVLLSADPANHATQLADSRFFEPQNITAEDASRSTLYKASLEGKRLQESITDMPTYLTSLEMKGNLSEFTPVDIPRLSQLINKSNQFNLTSRRRTEAEVELVILSATSLGYSFRLSDKFGDHGLISVVIAEQSGETLNIDTWLMSCRVLKRQVEDEVLNELIRLARQRGCTRIKGFYIPSVKNLMVRDFYHTMGFSLIQESETEKIFELDVSNFVERKTKILITHKSYESLASN